MLVIRSGYIAYYDLFKEINFTYNVIRKSLILTRVWVYNLIKRNSTFREQAFLTLSWVN
jgi:hypothetical protein